MIKEKNKILEEKRKKEREIWQQMVRQMRDKHYREFDKLKKGRRRCAVYEHGVYFYPHDDELHG